MKVLKFFTFLLSALLITGCGKSLFVSGGNTEEHEVDDDIKLTRIAASVQIHF